MDVQKLQNLISEKREQMVADMIEMSSIPAVNPKMGGTGEYARMQWIMRWFDKRQIPYEVYEVPDENVKEGVRLNVVVTIPGTKLTDRSLWFILEKSGSREIWYTTFSDIKCRFPLF